MSAGFGRTNAEVALSVMKVVTEKYSPESPDLKKNTGLSTLDKLHHMRCEPAVNLLTQTDWKGFFEHYRDNHIPPKQQKVNRSKSAAGKRLPLNAQQKRYASPQNSANPAARSESQGKVFDSLKITTEQLVKRVEMLWQELKFSNVERKFYRDSLCGAHPTSLVDQCQELAQYISVLKAYRAKTIDVLHAIDARESMLSSCKYIMDVKMAKAQEYSNRNRSKQQMFRDPSGSGNISGIDNPNFDDDMYAQATVEWDKNLKMSLLSLQESSYEVVSLIQQWRQLLWRPLPFNWNDVDEVACNYLLKICGDLDEFSDKKCFGVFDSIELTNWALITNTLSSKAANSAKVVSPVRGKNASSASLGPAAEEGDSDVRRPDDSQQDLQQAVDVVAGEGVLQRALIMEQKTLVAKQVFIPTLKLHS